MKGTLEVLTLNPSESDFSRGLEYLNDKMKDAASDGHSLIRIRAPPAFVKLVYASFDARQSEWRRDRKRNLRTKLVPVDRLYRRGSRDEAMEATLRACSHVEHAVLMQAETDLEAATGRTIELQQLWQSVACADSHEIDWGAVAKRIQIATKYAPLLRQLYEAVFSQVAACKTCGPMMARPEGQAPMKKARSREPEQSLVFEERIDRSWAEYEDSSKNLRDGYTSSHHCNGEDEMEKFFWEMVENGTPRLTVPYASDLSTEVYGSGFPPPGQFAEVDSWNLNSLAQQSPSPLAYLPGPLLGITKPLLYAGSFMAPFCWHTEDNYLYSINYLHAGAPKTWYGLSARDAESFEARVMEAFGDQSPRDLLHHLVTLIPPETILRWGLSVWRVVQHPGDMIITLPQAYHAGFSHGFNVAESCNFALPDWLPMGVKSMMDYQKVGRAAVFASELLLLRAEHLQCSPTPSADDRVKYYIPMWAQARKMEHSRRDTNRRRHPLRNERPARAPWFRSVEVDPPQCKICRTDLVFSANYYPCRKSLDLVFCADHTPATCHCDVAQHPPTVSLFLDLEEADRVAMRSEEKNDKDA